MTMCVRYRWIAVCCWALFLPVMVATSAQDTARTPESRAGGMNGIAERYVKLVLALGQHDADYVDAYYGPPEWRKEAEQTKRPLAEIGHDAAAAYEALAKLKMEPQAEEAVRLRHEYLTRQLSALRARVSML